MTKLSYEADSWVRAREALQAQSTIFRSADLYDPNGCLKLRYLWLNK